MQYLWMTVTVANDLSKHSDQTCDIVDPGSDKTVLPIKISNRIHFHKKNFASVDSFRFLYMGWKTIGICVRKNGRHWGDVI